MLLPVASVAALADVSATSDMPITIPMLAVTTVAAAAAFWALWRLRQEAEARRRVIEALASSRALLGAQPAAVYRCDRRTGAETVIPGASTKLGLDRTSGFTDFLACFDTADAAALLEARRRLAEDGAEFHLEARAARSDTLFEVVGRRMESDAGSADVIWFIEAGGRAHVIAERDAARAERDRLRQVLDALPLAVWRRRTDTLDLIDCNRVYGQAVEASRAQAIAEGRELGARVLGDKGRELAERARQTEIAQSESHHIVVAGQRRLMEFTEQPLDGGDEIVGFARDFTDLETMQAELARHVSAHGEVLENVTVAVAIFGPDTRLNFFNSAFAQLWRLEEDWLASEPGLDELLERLRERRRLPEYADFRAFKRQQLAMFTSLLGPQEELLHLPDERTLRLVVSPHPFGGLTFVYEDVTDKLALERSYNTLIEVQRETLDNLYEAVAVLGSDGRLKLWNPAYAQIWKLPAEALVGEPHVGEIVEKTRALFEMEGSPEPWVSLKERIVNHLMAHTEESERLQRADGSVLHASIVPLPDGNVLLSYLDITDSTRVERALRERNEALETAGRLKSEFIANVSYELRTPLNAIIGFAEILANQYFGKLNPRQQDYSRGILDSSHRLMSLINDILDLATIEAGYMTLETQEIDIHAMMSSVLTLARERARNQSLTLNFDCPADIGVIKGDERRLKQALFNLVSNALKFTPPGGTVTLSARRADDGEVALAVSDTGVGVPEEDHLRIFEKFERGNPQGRQSGPGLGLSLVKSFIELHGGRVELASSPGTGTTITCYLAGAPPAAATEESPAPLLQSSAGN
ncbi:MAG TPA: ATP-binding protein [Stellaceae bacterium]|nr:ATP-binding protein [Stellaceae bacterium]